MTEKILYAAFFDADDNLNFFEMSQTEYDVIKPFGKWFYSKEEVVDFLKSIGLYVR